MIKRVPFGKPEGGNYEELRGEVFENISSFHGAQQ